MFKAVMKWLDHQCGLKDMKTSVENKRKILGDSVYKIRFLVMEQHEFIETVASELLTYVEIIAIVRAMRGDQVPDLKWNPTILKRGAACRYRFLGLSNAQWICSAIILVLIVLGTLMFLDR